MLASNDLSGIAEIAKHITTHIGYVNLDAGLELNGTLHILYIQWIITH